MRRVCALLVLVGLVCGSTSIFAEPPRIVDTGADTWVATDGLGRTLPGHEKVGSPREGKFIGVFYFLWEGQHGSDGPYDVTKILREHPGAMTQPAHPAWGPQTHYHHWGEPLLGYYLADDGWVIRKHAQMLADADVDVIIFDVTNQVTYPKIYTKLCEVFMEARRDGCRTPQIAFLCPFWDPTRTVAKLHAELYGPGLFRELWFDWKGKPLIMADPKKVAPELRSFFTFRKPQPDYFQGPTGPDQWGWLERHPQHIFHNAAGEAEQMTVGVGQNTDGKRCCAFSEKNTLGRSWHGGKKDERPNAVNLGLNFGEQWEHALKIDPQFIFITGWNEWIAMRLPEFAGVREPVMFVDCYTQEYSRDVEPMKGGHLDHYYYQMIANIRRFKGVRAPRSAAAAAGSAGIAIDGRFEDWASVRPEFRDDRGDTMHRDHPGYDNAGRYVNRTGRNDFVAAKVTVNDKSVCFYAKTAEPISPREGRDWMLLFIDSDRDHRTGWAGYDFVVNREPQTPGVTSVQAYRDGWTWETVSRASCSVNENELELAIPRAALGIRGPADRPSFDFKWADNTGCDGDIAAFILNGDAAPNGRFNYRFE